MGKASPIIYNYIETSWRADLGVHMFLIIVNHGDHVDLFNRADRLQNFLHVFSFSADKLKAKCTCIQMFFWLCLFSLYKSCLWILPLNRRAASFKLELDFEWTECGLMNQIENQMKMHKNSREIGKYLAKVFLSANQWFRWCDSTFTFWHTFLASHYNELSNFLFYFRFFFQVFHFNLF